MKNTTRTPDRAAVAKSLRELAILFGRKRPPNENALREQGAGEARTLIKGVTK